MVVTLLQERGTGARPGLSLIPLDLRQALEGDRGVAVDAPRRSELTFGGANPLGVCPLRSQSLSLLQAASTSAATASPTSECG